MREFRIAGVATNIPFLQALVAHPDFVANRIDTAFIETHVAASGRRRRRNRRRPLFFEAAEPTAKRRPRDGRVERPGGIGAGVGAPAGDGRHDRCRRRRPGPPGQQIAIIESMKMEHLVTAPRGGMVTKSRAASGDTLMHGEPIVFLEPAEVDGDEAEEEADVDLDDIRPDLAEMMARQALRSTRTGRTRSQRRRKTNQRTARENIAALVDHGCFVEYGSLAIAAQRRRR